MRATICRQMCACVLSYAPKRARKVIVNRSIQTRFSNIYIYRNKSREGARIFINKRCTPHVKSDTLYKENTCKSRRIRKQKTQYKHTIPIAVDAVIWIVWAIAIFSFCFFISIQRSRVCFFPLKCLNVQTNKGISNSRADNFQAAQKRQLILVKQSTRICSCMWLEMYGKQPYRSYHFAYNSRHITYSSDNQ